MGLVARVPRGLKMLWWSLPPPLLGEGERINTGGENNYWWKRVKKDEIDKERSWLTNKVYNGYFIGT